MSRWLPFLLLAACAGTPATVERAPVIEERAAAPIADEAVLRRAMLDRLLDDIRRYHLFSEVWPRERWEADVPVLSHEVLEAEDREALLRALMHVAYSLRDGHVGFVAESPPHAEGILTLPLGFFVAGSGASMRVFVERASSTSGLVPGDELVVYDGTPVAELDERFRFDVRMAPDAARAAQLGNVLQWRFAQFWGALEGAPLPMTLRHADGSVFDAAPVFTVYEGAEGNTGDLDDYRVPDAPVCDDIRDRDYGPYALVRVGARVCLYRAPSGPYARYPLVRHHSFDYESEGHTRRLLELDHAMIRDFIASTPRLAGVILDLRDNGGGNSPHIFLDWYASGPYAAVTDEVRLHPELDDRARLEAALWRPVAVTEYLRRAALGEPSWIHAFGCVAPDCAAEEIHTPRHRVTDVPIAIFVGPGCASACDVVAMTFDANDFGPLIGTSTAAMQTSNRYPIEVRLGDEVLGQLSVAFSRARLGADGPWLEGRAITIDHVVEPSWPASSYEAAMRDAALAALR